MSYANPLGIIIVGSIVLLNLILIFVNPILGFFIGFLITLPIIFSAIRILQEYERGVLFTLGRYSGTLGPGLNIIVPIIQTVTKVDLRIKTIDIPTQTTITKDNVTVQMAVQAEAERERRAIIIKSEGEKIAAKTYLEAAEMMSKNKNALALRILQTLSDISKDPSQKFIFVLPIEMLEAFSNKVKKDDKDE